MITSTRSSPFRRPIPPDAVPGRLAPAAVRLLQSPPNGARMVDQPRNLAKCVTVELIGPERSTTAPRAHAPGQCPHAIPLSLAGTCSGMSSRPLRRVNPSRVPYVRGVFD